MLSCGRVLFILSLLITTFLLDASICEIVFRLLVLFEVYIKYFRYV